VIEVIGFLAPPPIVIDPVIVVDAPELAFVRDSWPTYDNVQWFGEPQFVLYGLPAVETPPLAFHVVPIPDSPVSNPGSAGVVAELGSVEITAATMSADVAASGPGGGVVVLVSDER
jgi:hypothetical protein